MHKPNLTLISTILLSGVLAGACGGAKLPAAPSSGQEQADVQLKGTITISGAFALYPMMTVWAEEFTKLHPQVQFDVQGGGAGKGMTDTLAGAVDIGMISREIKPEEEAQGAFWVSVAKDAVFPIVSSENPILDELMSKGISQEMFHGVFITGEIKTWGEVVGDPAGLDAIHVYTRADSAGAANQWALFAGGMVQADLQGIGINGEPALVDTVVKDALGIGFGNINSVFDASTGNLVPGVAVPPIDINGNGQADSNEYYANKEQALRVIADGTYPSPPARFENLATRGKPARLILEFLKWILTDGQPMLAEAGYVPLSPSQQAESLDKLQ